MNQMSEDGVEILLGAVPKQFMKMCEAENEQQYPQIQVTIDHQGSERVIEVEAVLFAVGRQPNVEGMGFEKAGIEFDVNKGVKVNKYLQTTNKIVYAAGDCCSSM